MIDAPVSGGPVGAERWQPHYHGRGKRRVYRGSPPRASGEGKNIFYIGPVGAGHTIRPSTYAGGGEHPGRVRGVGVGGQAGLVKRRLSRW